MPPVHDQGTTHAAGNSARAVLLRGAAFFGFWVVLIGVGPADLAAGVVAAAAATWASLRLAPPGAGRVRFSALPGFTLRFLWQSVIAGWDVARRAFDPRLITSLSPALLAIGGTVSFAIAVAAGLCPLPGALAARAGP